MKNFWNNIRYNVANHFHITLPEIERTSYENVYCEEFRTLHNWVVVNPDTVSSSRSNGAILTIRQLTKKGYVYPCIISRATLIGGSVMITTKLSPSNQVFHNFILKTKGKEIGFKITNESVFVINPVKSKKFKLFNPTNEHIFEIDVNPYTNMIYWRVDGITLYELFYPSHRPKRLVVSLPTIKTKMDTRSLPISFRIKSIDFFTYKTNKN